MSILLTVLHVLICFILIAVILLQAGRGQGLAGSNFAGGNVQSLFGTRAGDFLTKATTVSAVLFLFTCIGLDIVETQKSKSLFDRRQPASPVDVQQIQKVLEKIKAGEMLTPPPEKAGEKVKAATSQAKDAVLPAAPSIAEGAPDKSGGTGAVPARGSMPRASGQAKRGPLTTQAIPPAPEKKS